MPRDRIVPTKVWNRPLSIASAILVMVRRSSYVLGRKYRASSTVMIPFFPSSDERRGPIPDTSLTETAHLTGASFVSFDEIACCIKGIFCICTTQLFYSPMPASVRTHLNKLSECAQGKRYDKNFAVGHPEQKRKIGFLAKEHRRGYVVTRKHKAR